MQSKGYDLKTIGGGLALLYGTSLLFYLKHYPGSDYDFRARILVLILGLLFLASVAVTQRREWGRALIVGANAGMAVLLLKPIVIFDNFIPIGYILLNIVVFLYFNQKKIKARFMATNVTEWRSILIIDDDETLIKTVRPILISQGFSVLTANTGEHGMTIAQTQNPDLILLDVILPGIKGRDVCKLLKENEKTKDIPVIFLTAKNSPDDVEAEMAVGAEAHMTKPISPKSLLSTVRGIFKD